MGHSEGERESCSVPCGKLCDRYRVRSVDGIEERVVEWYMGTVDGWCAMVGGLVYLER